MYIMFDVSTQVLPSYRSSNKIPKESSVGSVVEVDDRGDEPPVERDEVLLAVHHAGLQQSG